MVLWYLYARVRLWGSVRVCATLKCRDVLMRSLPAFCHCHNACQGVWVIYLGRHLIQIYNKHNHNNYYYFSYNNDNNQKNNNNNNSKNNNNSNIPNNFNKNNNNSYNKL